MDSSLIIPRSNPGVDIRQVIDHIKAEQEANKPKQLPKEYSIQALPKHSLEYLYGIYRQRAKQIAPDIVMPRRIFNFMMIDVGSIDQGLEKLELFFQNVFEQMLQTSLEEKTDELDI